MLPAPGLVTGHHHPWALPVAAALVSATRYPLIPRRLRLLRSSVIRASTFLSCCGGGPASGWVTTPVPRRRAIGHGRVRRQTTAGFGRLDSALCWSWSCFPGVGNTPVVVFARGGVGERWRLRPCLVSLRNFFHKKDKWIHRILNKIYLRFFFTDGCNFSSRI